MLKQSLPSLYRQQRHRRRLHPSQRLQPQSYLKGPRDGVMASIAGAVRERASEDSIAGIAGGGWGSCGDHPSHVVAGRDY